MFERLGELLLRRRALVLWGVGLVTLAALVLLPGLKFNFTPQAIFQGDEELHAFTRSLQETFQHEDNILIAVLEAPEGEDVLTPEALGWQKRASDEILEFSEIVAVDSLATVGIPRESADQPGVLNTSPLVKSLPVSGEVATMARRAAKEAVLLHGQIVSKDLQLGVLAIRLDPEHMEIDDVTAAVERVEAWVEANPPPDKYSVFYNGVPWIRRDIVSTLKREQLTILPSTAVLFLIVLAFLFRKPSGVILPLLCVGVAVAWTMASLVVFDQYINIINNILATLLFVIGISDSVHIVTRYSEEFRASPESPGAALKRTVAHLGFACFLTSSTTAVGFLSLVVARTELLRSFGWQAALGAILSYVVTIALMGAFLPTMQPPTRKVMEAEGSGGWIERVVDALARAVIRRPKITMALALLVVAFSLWMTRNVEVNTHLVEAYNHDHPEVQTMRVVEERLGGFLSATVSIKAPGERAFLEPSLYRRVAQLQAFAAQQEGVLQARSYVDIHQEMKVALLGDSSQRKVLPPEGEKGKAQLYQIQELIDAGAKELGYHAFVTPGMDHARIRLRVADIGSKRTLELAQQVEAEAAKIFPPEVEVKMAGETYTASSGIDGFIRDLFYSLMAAVVVIFAMMGFLFKSLRAALLSILPNTTPLVLLVGYMGVMGYDLNTTNVIIFAISLGLAVNDTIHFLTRFKEEIEKDPDVGRAILGAFRGAGRAIVLTTVLLVLGLSMILLSDFLPSRRFAELTGLTLAGALLGDLILLPACLMLFWKSPASRDIQKTETAHA